MKTKNGIAILLLIIAILTFVGGAYLGYEEGQYYSSYDRGYHIDFVEALPYWSAALVSGSLFLGFYQVIQLLQNIYDNEVSKSSIKEAVKEAIKEANETK